MERFPFLNPLGKFWLEIQTSEARRAMPEEEGRRAGDMVGKGTSTMELLYGSLSGMAFGLVSPIAGQPFDIVKTKMQADARFLKSSPFSVVKTVVATEGVRGMYRGMLPILASTGVQKTVLFTANAGDQRARTCTPACNRSYPGCVQTILPRVSRCSARRREVGHAAAHRSHPGYGRAEARSAIQLAFP